MEKISANTNALNWFEIPVTDTERAKKFYETIFDIKMETNEMMGMEMTSFPYDMPSNSGRISGALVKGPMHKPAMDGAVVYLNGTEVFRSNMSTGLISANSLALNNALPDTTYFETTVPRTLAPWKAGASSS